MKAGAPLTDGSVLTIEVNFAEGPEHDFQLVGSNPDPNPRDDGGFGESIRQGLSMTALWLDRWLDFPGFYRKVARGRGLYARLDFEQRDAVPPVPKGPSAQAAVILAALGFVVGELFKKVGIDLDGRVLASGAVGKRIDLEGKDFGWGELVFAAKADFDRADLDTQQGLVGRRATLLPQFDVEHLFEHAIKERLLSSCRAVAGELRQRPENKVCGSLSSQWEEYLDQAFPGAFRAKDMLDNDYAKYIQGAELTTLAQAFRVLLRFRQWEAEEARRAPTPPAPPPASLPPGTSTKPIAGAPPTVLSGGARERPARKERRVMYRWLWLAVLAVVGALLAAHPWSSSASPGALASGAASQRSAAPPLATVTSAAARVEPEAKSSAAPVTTADAGTVSGHGGRRGTGPSSGGAPATAPSASAPAGSASPAVVPVDADEAALAGARRVLDQRCASAREGECVACQQLLVAIASHKLASLAELETKVNQCFP